MTYANFSKGISSPYVPFVAPENLHRNSVINHLVKRMQPLSKGYIDKEGNYFRFWLWKSIVLGTLTKADGTELIIPAHKIINPCSNNKLCSPLTLEKLKNSNLDIVYNSHKNEIIIFPHLKASAKDEIDSKTIQAEEKKSWTSPRIMETGSRLGHIFRDAPGHLKEDTPKNREYILAAVSDPANKVGENKFGREIYCKTMSDGYRAWAHVEKGFIINGGRDVPWRKWKPDPEEYLSGRMVPIVTIFREQIQIDRLTNVFNTTIAENHWEPHPLETITVSRDVGGVRHETGIIVDLLEELQSSLYDDYLFFIPKTEGSNLLDKKEILQIVQEIAKGIYLHDTIPFFSLNMNPQQQNYSIIHPCYQNTYVGHVISMLDYYLKGFWTGQLFDQNFIQEWSKNPSIDDTLLQQHLLSMKELCQLHQETPFHSFDQILQRLIQENSLTEEQLHILGKETQNLVLSCKILGKQNSISKYKNLFVLDGKVQLIHTVEWTPDGPDQELCHQILDQACNRVCQQIQDIGFKIPILEKWLSVLQIMNFFSTYFRTVQQAEKIPIFAKPIQIDSQKICPSIFPPIPHPSGPQVEIEPKAILNTFSSSQKQLLEEFCQKDSEDSRLKQTLQSIFLQNIKNFPMQYSSEHLQPCIDTILSAFRTGYRTIDQQVQKLFIHLQIISGSYHATYRIILNFSINLARDNLNSEISDLKNKVASQKIYNQDSRRLEELLQTQKALTQATEWISDPLSTLVQKETWLYDIEQKKLIPAQKTSCGETLKVYGGYEPNLTDIHSQQSPLAKNIAQQNTKKLEALEYENIIPIAANSNNTLFSTLFYPTKNSSGIVLKLPLEDSFPLSSYGLSYHTIQLFASSIHNIEDHNFYTLLQSIREKDLESFTAHYLKEIDYNRLDLLGKAAIHYAALSSSTYFLQELIHKKINLLTPDSQGWTALHHAANAGNVAAIELLLSAAPESLNRVGVNGETPIYLAVHNNQKQIVEKLLQANADLNLKPSHGYNVLLSAIHNGHEELALLLVQSGKIDLNYAWRNGKTALHFAIEMKMEKLLEEILRRGVDRNQPYLSKKPIIIAQEQG
ncbi:MAG: ankyrin repeat domain-containing protein [Chlamydiales bacterium]